MRRLVLIVVDESVRGWDNRLAKKNNNHQFDGVLNCLPRVCIFNNITLPNFLTGKTNC
jgi:hypothetical protein